MSHRDDAFADWMEGCPEEYREEVATKFDGSLCAAIADFNDARADLGRALYNALPRWLRGLVEGS